MMMLSLAIIASFSQALSQLVQSVPVCFFYPRFHSNSINFYFIIIIIMLFDFCNFAVETLFSRFGVHLATLTSCCYSLILENYFYLVNLERGQTLMVSRKSASSCDIYRMYGFCFMPKMK